MRVLLFVLAFTPSFIFGQIILTEADFANAGDTIRVSLATDPTIDFTSTGINQSWDFTYLIADQQELIEYYDMSNASTLVNFVYGLFAPTEYKASYFMPTNDLPLDLLSGVLPVTISDINQFSRKTVDSITSVGYALSVEGNEVPFKSDTIETRYKFPINLGDTYSSRGYTNMDLNPISNTILRQYRQRNVIVDGWGSIATAYGTFQSLRLKHTISEVDSIQLDIAGNPFWIEIPIPESYIYEWWTNSEKEPLLSITTNDVFGTETVSEIKFRQDYLGLDLGVAELELNIEIYPNPTTDEINISGLNNASKYTIVDSKGTIILTGSTEGKIDVSSISHGTYQLILHSDNMFGIKTFIKK